MHQTWHLGAWDALQRQMLRRCAHSESEAHVFTNITTHYSVLSAILTCLRSRTLILGSFERNLESSWCKQAWKRRLELLPAATWHPIFKVEKERMWAHKTHNTQHGLQARACLLQILLRASLLLSSLADSVARRIFVDCGDGGQQS